MRHKRDSSNERHLIQLPSRVTCFSFPGHTVKNFRIETKREKKAYYTQKLSSNEC